jgi:hypothetical protein
MRNQMVYAENISSFKWTLKILGLWPSDWSAFGKKGDEQQRQLRAEVIVMRHPLTGLVTT